MGTLNRSAYYFKRRAGFLESFFAFFSYSNCCNHVYKSIYYSDKYYDDKYEYRHVMLPKDLAKLVPKNHLMAEAEWRGIGVQQSQGWIHYMIHQPEPHILLFRRPITTPPAEQNES